MRRAKWILVALAVLTMAGASAVAADFRPAVYGPGHHVQVQEVHHPGHRGYHSGFRTVVIPAPVYVRPAYPPAVVYPPATVYPPAYAAPEYYYYPQPGGYLEYRNRGLSIGIGL